MPKSRSVAPDGSCLLRSAACRIFCRNRVKRACFALSSAKRSLSGRIEGDLLQIEGMDIMAYPVVNEADCCGCETCVDACPNGALEIVDGIAKLANPD
ncbi:MAG: ATP-binding protein, partial [Eggerthellaceae bacterium]